MERYIFTDVLAEILQRLPPSSRRRARLVCRHWRDVVNNCFSAEMQSRPKLLIWDDFQSGIAYVADDMSPSSTGRCTMLWRTSDPRHHYYGGLQLVGTCNGLLCLCDNEKTVGGGITLFNPATGETMPVPPLPCAGSCVGHRGSRKWGERWRWGDGYSFAYHPITGQYKVVHVPCNYEWGCEFDAVHVITLGDGTWREVSAGPGGAVCKLAAGVVSADGTTYWVRDMGGIIATHIASFDLMHERVVSTTIPMPAQHDRCRLAEVHGRLGFVAPGNVWVLEEGQRWSHRYIFEKDSIPRGHFVYGEHVLTYKPLHLFHLHRPKGTPSAGKELTREPEVVSVGHQDKGMLVAELYNFTTYFVTYAYVETV